MHNRSVFDWDDIRFFLAVARHNSTLAAGRALGVNQSTVKSIRPRPAKTEE